MKNSVEVLFDRMDKVHMDLMTRCMNKNIDYEKIVRKYKQNMTELWDIIRKQNL